MAAATFVSGVTGSSVFLFLGWPVGIASRVSMKWFDAGFDRVVAASMVVSVTTVGGSGAAIPILQTGFATHPAQSTSNMQVTSTGGAGFSSFFGITTLLARLMSG